jgi:HK97 family phage portal protein
VSRPTRGKPTAVAARKSRRSPVALSRVKPKNAGRIKVSRPDSFLLHPWLKEAGVYVTSETASQVAAVYGCCRLIVDCLAPAPITVTEMQRGGVRELLHDDPVSWTLNYGAPIALLPDAPTSQAIEEALYWAALLGDGNGYAEIQRDMSGRFVGLWPIESDRVTPRRDASGYYYEIQQPEGGVARLEPADCFHLRGPSLKGWVGDSVVYRAAKAIGIAHASQVYSAAYFANGTVLSGLLTTDKPITPAQAKSAKERFVEEHSGGPGKAHGVSALGQGVKYQPLNHNAQEAMLIDSRRFQVQEIARFYGVPTTLLADNEAWTNLSELYLGFYRNALRPWAERFDAEATRKLFPQRQPWREVAHDLTHLTLGSFKDQVAALVQATGNKAIWTQNEARAIFGKNSVEGGDELVTEDPKPAMPPGRSQFGKPPPGQDPGAAPDEGDDQAEPAPKQDRSALSARDALVAMFADAFGRHTRRVKNRKADLKRELDDKERTGLVGKLIEDSTSALELLKRGLGGATPLLDLAAYAEALDAGEPPDKSAARLVASVWPEEITAPAPAPEGAALAEAVQSGLVAVGAGLAGRQPGELEFVRDDAGQVTGARFKN